MQYTTLLHRMLTSYICVLGVPATLLPNRLPANAAGRVADYDPNI